MKKVPAKAPEWPNIIRNESVSLKIYRVENKGWESFTLSYHSVGKRALKIFASLDEAVAEGKATTLANGELDALHLARPGCTGLCLLRSNGKIHHHTAVST